MKFRQRMILHHLVKECACLSRTIVLGANPAKQQINFGFKVVSFAESIQDISKRRFRLIDLSLIILPKSKTLLNLKLSIGIGDSGKRTF